jgi:hypothetical protein
MNIARIPGAPPEEQNMPTYVPQRGVTAGGYVAAHPPKTAVAAMAAGSIGNELAEGAGQIATVFNEAKKERALRKQYENWVTKGEAGVDAYIQDARGLFGPEIDQWIPPKEVFVDPQSGLLDIPNYYEHAAAGIIEYRKNKYAMMKAQTAAETAKLKATPSPEETDLLKAKAEKERAMAAKAAKPATGGGSSKSNNSNDANGKSLRDDADAMIQKAINQKELIGAVDEEIRKAQEELTFYSKDKKNAFYVGERARAQAEIKALEDKRKRSVVAMEVIAKQTVDTQTNFNRWRAKNPNSDYSQATTDYVQEIYSLLGDYLKDKEIPGFSPPSGAPSSGPIGAAGPTGAPTAQPAAQPAQPPPGSALETLLRAARNGDAAAQDILKRKGRTW